MWTLECDGDLFGGKSIWLRPGHKLIFGRTKPAAEDTSHEQSWVITHKSVSRKHLVIDVFNVAPGSADDLRERTEIRLIDNSKLGTTLDGHKFKDANVALSKVEHTVSLGSWEQKFIIKWRPVVLTPSMLSTKQKKAADPLSNYRERVESLGVKLSLDYIVGQTTHVIANKRNSAKNLQALINGKYVVTEAFIEALLNATTPRLSTASGDGSTQAPLEVDFDANWPNPLDYVPAPGREPVPRSSALYAPNEARLDMFSGHTVIFLEQVQLENLQDVINNGGGKAVLYDVSAANTDLATFVTFVGELKPQKPILVRFRGGDEEDEQWKKDFQQASQLALSQRSIDQNEFLDAIIMADITALKQPLQEEIEIASSIPPPRSLPAGMRNRASQQRAATGGAKQPIVPAASQDEHAQNDSIASQAGPEPPLRKKTFRAPYKSRFTGIDDFDPSQITKYDDDDEGDEGQGAMSDIEEENETSGLPERFASNGPSARKRTHEDTEPASDPVDTTSILNQMTSANDRYKRRKVAAGGQIASIPSAADKTPPKPVNAVVQAMENLRRVRQKHESGRDKTDHDPKQETSKSRARKAELEEQRLRQDEDLREQIGNADPSQVRALIRFEEMSISSRHVEPARADGAAKGNDRWDERWNGRKNFKRFHKARRAGDASEQTPPPNQQRRVIVALEEARKKDFSLGEGYWLEDREETPRRESGRRSGEHVFNTQQSREKNGASESQAIQGSNGDSSRRNSQRPTPRSQNTSASNRDAVQGTASTLGRRRAVEEEDSEPENIEVVEKPATQLRSGKVAETQASIASTTSSKRRAGIVPLQEAPRSSKRRATTRSRRGRTDNSSDDELRFKFKKKG